MRLPPRALSLPPECPADVLPPAYALQELLALRKEFDAQQALLNRYTANPGLQTPAAGAVVEDPMEAAGKRDGVEAAAEEDEDEDDEGVREGEEGGEKKQDGGTSKELGKVEKPV